MDGSTLFDCDADFCDVVFCFVGDCIVNYCGGCYVEYYLNGN